MFRHILSIGLGSGLLAACTDAATGQSGTEDVHPTGAHTQAQPGSPLQRGGGLPYEVAGTQVWDVPDPVSGRGYQVFVALPPSYAAQPARRYPVLYVTDADYAFPLLKQIGRRLNVEGTTIQEFILVGLSYAKGEDGMTSRRRDYTPTAKGSTGPLKETVHGRSQAYQTYLRQSVLPFVAQRFRTDERRRVFLGHSYGSLLGIQILLSEPRLFDGYILGSPSIWYDRDHIAALARDYAAGHDDLPARVYMYVGEYEETHPGDPRFAKSGNMVTDTRNMDRKLRSSGYPSLHLRTEVLNDEDHVTVAPRGFTHGLKYLLPAGNALAAHATGSR